MTNSFEQIKEQLSKTLSGGRFRHTLGVVQTAKELAVEYIADPQKAELAGLLHDCAKEIKGEILLKEAQRFKLKLHKTDEVSPYLLHARIGAEYAKEQFGIKDQEILDAIAQHTLGKPQMSRLEEILFVADAIEPNRLSEWANPIRQILKEKGLDFAIVKTCEHTIKEVIEKKQLLHPLTVETYNFYLLKASSSDGLFHKS